jgi:YD repeat-containing protein
VTLSCGGSRVEVARLHSSLSPLRSPCHCPQWSARNVAPLLPATAPSMPADPLIAAVVASAREQAESDDDIGHSACFGLSRCALDRRRSIDRSFNSGNLATKVDPRGNVVGANPDDYKTTYTYDATGRLLTTTGPDPDGAGWQTASVTTNHYDAVGNLDWTKDANHQTNYTYDAAGRILTVQAPDGGVTTYTYDSDGNIARASIGAGRCADYRPWRSEFVLPAADDPADDRRRRRNWAGGLQRPGRSHPGSADERPQPVRERRLR